MDGIADQIQLTVPRCRRFGLAAPGDEREILRLLRENPMAGNIRLSQEPMAGNAENFGELVHQTLVGRRSNGTLFGVATRSVRRLHVNGRAMPVGYLGTLRLDADHRNNPRTLLRGYDALRELHSDGACPFYLTSIMADNLPARRFVEANVRGMPMYRFVGELVSLVMAVRPGTSCDQTAPPMREIVELVNQTTRRYQFSPAWADDSLPAGLTPGDFRIARDSYNRVVGCAALWDQRAIRQMIVRGYSPWLGRCRPMLNAMAMLTGRARLPEPGEALRLAYISHMGERISPSASTPEKGRGGSFGISNFKFQMSDSPHPNPPPEYREKGLIPIIAALHAAASVRRIDYLVAGFPAGDPLLRALRHRFGGRELRSRLYLVYWPDGESAAASIDERPARPEVGLL